MSSNRIQVDVWFLPLDVPADRLASLTGLLSADELERANRFHQPIHRSRWIASRGQVRERLARVLGREASLISFESEAQGRPELSGADKGLASINWSHSDNWGALALSFEARVGLDIEASRPIGEEDITYALSPAEREEMSGLSGAARQEAFFRFWTLKEAFMKGVGAGASLPLHDFDMTLSGPGLARLKGSPEAPGQWRLAETIPRVGWHCAVAVRSEGREIVTNWHEAGQSS
jgi:4'-phosphopantetheinyl transferase